MNFEGKKFRPNGTVVKTDMYGNQVVKTTFLPTAAYMKYLEEKRKEEREQKLLTMRSKLEYQQKTYGEVDPIDLAEFQYYLTH